LSSRLSFALGVLVLLIAAGLRLWQLTTLPPGLHPDEITDIRITETVRTGRIEVFYNINGEGREGLYHTVLAASTFVTGRGSIGYHIFSVWLGLLTLALVYAVAIRLFGPLAALASMALLAFGMWPTLLARQIGRETAVPLLIASVLLTLAMALPVYAQPRRRETGNASLAILGVLLGLGLYLHPIGLVTALFGMVFIAYIVVSRPPTAQRRLGPISFAILVTIIIAMPYVISSLRRPEFGGAKRLLGDYRSLLQSIGDGLVGVVFQGDANPIYNLPGRPLIDLVSGLLVVIGVVVALRWWRQPRFALLIIATLVMAPTALLVTDSPHFLAYASLLPLLALFFGVGVSGLMNSLRGGARRVAAVGFVALALLNIGWTARDLFGQWPHLPEVQTAYHSRLGQLAHYIDLTADEISTVVCARNLNQYSPTTELTGAQLLVQMMNRQNAPVRYADCATALVFINGGEREQVILTETNTLERMHPYLADWLRRGEIATDPNLPPESIIWLDVTAPLADTIGRFTTTALAGYAPEAQGSENLVAPPVAFGGNLALLGYEKQEAARYKPGDILTLITYWRVDGVVPPDLVLFTHLLVDPGARPVAQTDTISVDPRQLQNRDVFTQVTYVPLPSLIPDGEYFISVGAYQDTSDERLFVFDGNAPRGDRLFLYPITVARGG
jgi:4-amino-4-deoxy-L-arabinose transferase-like glycosyltransferase